MKNSLKKNEEFRVTYLIHISIFPRLLESNCEQEKKDQTVLHLRVFIQ